MRNDLLPSTIPGHLEQMAFYKALQPGHIRLLLFIDESGRRCKIEEHALAEAPEYWTLSYPWSDDSPNKEENDPQTYEIEVNGHPFPVQKKLSSAFKHIAPLAHRLKRYMWADYICINQNDDVEKSSQVRMMKDIYAKAKVVRA